MSILVPIDDSAASEVALRGAERMARAEQSTIVVVTVGELAETGRHAEEAEARLQKRLEEASSWITEVPVRRRVQLAGDPVRGILEVAEDEGVERIVIASPQRDAFAELMHDSVSEDVRAGSHVPVTVIEIAEDTNEPRRATA